jgi:1-acyl-sn-glycerol-3-phosphate acyltransferase
VRRYEKFMKSSRAETPALSPSPFFWAAYPVLHLGFRCLVKTFAPRWSISGRANIPPRGGVLFAPNHISDLDPPFVNLSLRRPAWFMAKRELFEIPILAPFIRFAQAFPVERGGADRAALKYAEQLLKNGQALVIYPEGRLSKTGDLQPLLPGVTSLAIRAGVPLVPVGLAGSNHVMPYGAVTPRLTFKKVRVHFGEPLNFDDLKELPSRAGREESTRRLETALRAAIATARSTS